MTRAERQQQAKLRVISKGMNEPIGRDITPD
jgi:hypothetical protein